MLWKRVGSILRFCYNDNETLGLDSTCFATGENIEFIPFVYDEANFLTNQKCFIITGQNIMAHHWYCYQ